MEHMKSLPINKALQLYKLLAPYLPDTTTSTEVLDFAGKIIENLQNSENQQDYFTAITLMTDKDQDHFLQIGAVKTLELFIDGLVINDIVSLTSFCEKVGIHA